MLINYRYGCWTLAKFSGRGLIWLKEQDTAPIEEELLPFKKEKIELMDNKGTLQSESEVRVFVIGTFLTAL